MTSTPSTLIDSAATPVSARPRHHHPHLHGAGKRIRHLFLPNGRAVRIAENPDEVRRISQALQVSEKDAFDLVLQGSPEHVR